MKILYACAYLPWPLNTGGRIRSYHLLRRLAARHEVHLLALDHDGAGTSCREALRSVCRSATELAAPTRAPGAAGRLLRLILAPDNIVLTRWSRTLEGELRPFLSCSWDLVVLDDLATSCYLSVSGRPPALISKHNVEWRLLERAADNRQAGLRRLMLRVEATRLRRAELQAVDHAEAVIVPGEPDARSLSVERPKARVQVLANGVDTRQLRPAPRPAGNEGTMLFVGALFWRPNIEGLSWFVQGVLPLIRRDAPGSRLVVVGSDPAPAARGLAAFPGVEWVGPVPDVRPYLARATVCVVPLHNGSGTRLKIPEALAAGRVVVSTPVGAEGLDLQPDEGCLQARTDVAFADAVLHVLRDGDCRTRLEQAGRAAAVARYDWSVTLRGLDSLCAAVKDGAGA